MIAKLGGATLVAAALLFVGGCDSDDEVRTTEKSVAASPAMAALTDADEFDLASLEGTVVILDFWAVW